MALSITPIELNGMVGRTQDFASLKAAEDGKANVDQMNFSTVVDHNVETKSTTVGRQDDTSDAKDDGASRNKYDGDGGRNRRRGSKIPDSGRVIVKSSGGFDASV